MFGHQLLVVYLCVGECICVSAHRLPYIVFAMVLLSKEMHAPVYCIL